MENITKEQMEQTIRSALPENLQDVTINDIEYFENSKSYAFTVVLDAKNYYEFVIPEDVSNVTSVASYVGPENNDVTGIQSYRNATINDPNLNVITVMTNCSYDGSLNGNGDALGLKSLETVTSIAKAFGCDVNQAIQSSYSRGDYHTIASVNDYSGNHPDISITYVNNEGINSSCWNENSVSNMIANGNVTVIYNGEDYVSEDVNTVEKICSLGVPVYFVTHDVPNKQEHHALITASTFSDGYINYFLGLSDKHENTYGRTYYKMSNDVDENGNHIVVKTPYESEDEFYSDYFTFNAPLELNLKDKMAIRKGETGTVASNLCAVAVAMNELNSEASSFSPSKMAQLESTASIPVNLSNCTNGFLSISGGILGNLSKEAELGVNVAQCFYDMDNDLASRAYSLSDGTELLGGVKSVSDIENYLSKFSIESSINMPTFMFDPQSHKEGNSGSISKEELKNIINPSSPLMQNLTNEKNNSKDIKSTIGNFKDIINNGQLSGAAWDTMSSKLDKYDALMDKRIKYSDDLQTVITEAVKSIITYMGDYDVLDDTKLEEERANEKNILALIEDAKDIINATDTVATYSVSKTGRKRFTGYTKVYRYSESIRNAAKVSLAEYEEDLLECRQLIAMLENLWQIIAKAEQMINDVLYGMYSDYAVEANNLVVGQKSEYIPPANTSFTYNDSLYKSKNNSVTKIPWYKVTEEKFNKSKTLNNLFDSYEDYINGVHKVDSDKYAVEKVSEREFNSDSSLKENYETYNDYLHEVKEKNTVPDGFTSNTMDPNIKNNTANNNSNVNVNTKTNVTTKVEVNGDADVTTSTNVTTKTDANGNTKVTNTTNTQSGSSNVSKSQGSSSSASSSQGSSSSAPSSQGSSSSTSSSQRSSSSSTPVNSTESNNSSQSQQNPSLQSNIENKEIHNTNTNLENKSNDINNGRPSVNEKNYTVNNRVANNKPKVTNNFYEKTSINNNTNTPIVDNTVYDEPIIEDPIVNDPMVSESIINEPIVEEPIVDVPTIEKQAVSSSNNALKGIAIAAGIGSAVGAAAYGAHKYIKNKKENDEDEDE